MISTDYQKNKVLLLQKKYFVCCYELGWLSNIAVSSPNTKYDERVILKSHFGTDIYIYNLYIKL